jgi:hypothetical protein
VLDVTAPLGNIRIYLSFAGVPRPGEINQLIENQYQANVTLILATFDPATCNGDFKCEFLLGTPRAGGLENALDVKNSSFAATATAAEVPLPAALPLFATGIGALGALAWRRQRRTKVDISEGYTIRLQAP